MTPENDNLDYEMKQMEKRAAAEHYAEGIAKMLGQVTGKDMDPAAAELFKRGMAESLCPTPAPMPFPGMPAKLPKVRPHLFIHEGTSWDWVAIGRESTHAVQSVDGSVIVWYFRKSILNIPSGPAADDFLGWIADQRALFEAMPGNVFGGPR